MGDQSGEGEAATRTASPRMGPWPPPSELIKQAVTGIQAEVPALANLKVVIGLELRGRGDTQLYRVECSVPR